MRRDPFATHLAQSGRGQYKYHELGYRKGEQERNWNHKDVDDRLTLHIYPEQA